MKGVVISVADPDMESNTNVDAAKERMASAMKEE